MNKIAGGVKKGCLGKTADGDGSVCVCVWGGGVVCCLWSRLKKLHSYRVFTITVKGAKFNRPLLGAEGFWAGRNLYRVTPAGTRGSGFCASPQFSRIVRQPRGTEDHPRSSMIRHQWIVKAWNSIIFDIFIRKSTAWIWTDQRTFCLSI